MKAQHDTVHAHLYKHCWSAMLSLCSQNFGDRRPILDVNIFSCTGGSISHELKSALRLLQATCRHHHRWMRCFNKFRDIMINCRIISNISCIISWSLYRKTSVTVQDPASVQRGHGHPRGSRGHKMATVDNSMRFDPSAFERVNINSKRCG